MEIKRVNWGIMKWGANKMRTPDFEIYDGLETGTHAYWRVCYFERLEDTAQGQETFSLLGDVNIDACKKGCSKKLPGINGNRYAREIESDDLKYSEMRTPRPSLMEIREVAVRSGEILGEIC
ncbi:U3 small nucleolar RNA-associated protein 25 [Striga asiatica]|uniref:U3 small nucleolar RNA-associated protein 25 n=1 Tax=Striga asiatica TaxID=4170 RepID=A0A5A7PHW9_STRAF|nr:U3 small nucleolar RNA-associated protein 25 [Striga asiatica]